jgi:hypothetical protein
LRTSLEDGKGENTFRRGAFRSIYQSGLAFLESHILPIAFSGFFPALKPLT